MPQNSASLLPVVLYYYTATTKAGKGALKESNATNIKPKKKFPPRTSLGSQAQRISRCMYLTGLLPQLPNKTKRSGIFSAIQEPPTAAARWLVLMKLMPRGTERKGRDGGAKKRSMDRSKCCLLLREERRVLLLFLLL